MLLRLFSTLGAPAISYGCEVWGSLCHGRLLSVARRLQGVQIAFVRYVCGRLPVDILQLPFCAEWEDPCRFKWCFQLHMVRFALRPSDLPRGALYCEILRDDVQDALARPSFGTDQVVKHFQSLGMPATTAHSVTTLNDKSRFCCHAAGKDYEVW